MNEGKKDSVFDEIPLYLLHHAQSVHLETNNGEKVKIKDRTRIENDEEYVHIVIPRSRLSLLKGV